MNSLVALALSALCLLPPAAMAADEPEAVYAKFHRAAMAGDLAEMAKYGPAVRRAEIQGMSESSKEAAIKMAQFMMPRAFTLQRKTLQSNGRATLIVSGPWDGDGRKLETMYGTVKMLTENGEWKVAESDWSSDRPAALATAAPKPGAAPAAASKAGASPPGSASPPTPERKLGTAKPPCVYKAVMTAEDVENCK